MLFMAVSNGSNRAVERAFITNSPFDSIAGISSLVPVPGPVTLPPVANFALLTVEIAVAMLARMVPTVVAIATMLAGNGIADDMLSTTVLATKAPILLAPAMNTGMWTAEATQANLKILRSRGVMTIGPGNGILACGDSGDGRNG